MYLQAEQKNLQLMEEFGHIIAQDNQTNDKIKNKKKNKKKSNKKKKKKKKFTDDGRIWSNKSKK